MPIGDQLDITSCPTTVIDHTIYETSDNTNNEENESEEPISEEIDSVDQDGSQHEGDSPIFSLFRHSY